MELGYPISKTDAYHRFVERWAWEISVDEARSAEETFRRGQAALACVAAVWVGIILTASLLERHLLLAAVLSDMAQALVIVSSLVLAAVYRVSFAGRLLIPLGMLEATMEVPFYSWDDTSQFVAVTFFLFIVFWAFGWMLDFGAALESRTHPRAPAALLLIFSLLFSGFIILIWSQSGREDGWPFPYGVVFACALCAVWPWWPGLWLRRRRPPLERDSEIVHEAAVRRWLSLFLGRFLAVLFAVFPLLLFLNNLDLTTEKLHLGSGDKLLKTSGDAGEASSFWYWPTLLPSEGKGYRAEGRFLRLGDLVTANVYGFDPDAISREEKAAIDAAVEAVSLDAADGESFAKLQKHLSPHLLRDASAFESLVSKAGDQSVLYQLGRARARPSLAKPHGADVHFVQEDPFEEVTRESIEVLRAKRFFAESVLAVCGALGFLLLWRRGGDSPVARWLSLWLVGWGIAVASSYSPFYMPTVMYNLWRIALDSPFGSLVLTLLGTLEFLAQFNVFFAFIPLPLVALWIHLCWPVIPTQNGWRWKQWKAFVAKVLLSLVISLVVFCASGFLGASWLGEEFFWIFGLAGFTLVAIGLGALVRQRTAARSEIPQLGVLPVVAFLCFQAALIVDDLFGKVAEGHYFRLSVQGLVLIGVFAAICLWLILSRDLLSLSAGWDFSRILLIAILPLLFEWSEDLAGLLLKATSFFSESGQTVVSLVIVVMLLGPIEKVLQRLVPGLAMPRLLEIERRVERALEEIADTRGGEDVRKTATGVFLDLKIDEYLLYGRCGKEKMELLVGTMGDAIPQEFSLSQELRSHLVRRCGSVVDLADVPLQWKHFFHQFEMARLELVTRTRYLLPVCFGNSLRGIVLLPEALDGHPVCRDLAGAEVGKLGVVVAETGRSVRGGEAGMAAVV